MLPRFRFAQQLDVGRAGREPGAVRRIWIDVDGPTRLPIVVKGSAHDQIRTTVEEKNMLFY